MYLGTSKVGPDALNEGWSAFFGLFRSSAMRISWLIWIQRKCIINSLLGARFLFYIMIHALQAQPNAIAEDRHMWHEYYVVVPILEVLRREGKSL